jgi:hypothetical protein
MHARSNLFAFVVGLVLVVLSASSAQAQTLNVKTGLWEVTTMGQMNGAPPVDTSKMTPEQAARVEAMMKASAARGGTPRTFKECLTKEKLAKDPFQDPESKHNCKRTDITRTSTVMAFKEECVTETGKTTAEGHFETTSTEQVKGTVKINIDRNGRSMNMNTQVTAKYLGASCGDVK